MMQKILFTMRSLSIQHSLDGLSILILTTGWSEQESGMFMNYRVSSIEKYLFYFSNIKTACLISLEGICHSKVDEIEV